MFSAGIDWSGKPGRDDTLICVIAAIADAQAWSGKCADLRHILGMKQSAEFHARDMSEMVNLTVLQAAKDAGIIFGVLAIKRANANNQITFLFNYERIAEELFRIFAARDQMRKLWDDKEIQGRVAEYAFETKLRCINRTSHPKSTFKARSRPSNKIKAI